jgi:hypothetical protein
MHRAVIGLIVVLLICSSILQLPINAQTDPSPALKAAVNYLIENYNSTVELIPEVPGGNTYWLYSDSFLASLALDSYNSQYPGNSTIVDIALNLSRAVSHCKEGLADSFNQYMLLKSTNVSLNPVIIHNSSSYTVYNYTVGRHAGAIINVTTNDGSGILSPDDYADIAFIEAVLYHNIALQEKANANYQVGGGMYNGVGMNDSAFQKGTQKDQYQTYKLALYLYASKTLGVQFPDNVETNMLRMQSGNGGFYTGYDKNFLNNGTDTNVETTSLAILALLPAHSSPMFPAFAVAVSAVIVIALTGILVKLRSKIRHRLVGKKGLA